LRRLQFSNTNVSAMQPSIYEHHKEPLIGRRAYLTRVLRHLGLTVALLAVSLLIGYFGFRVFANLKPMEAFVDACMLLGGMGPVKCGSVESDSGKIFASLYALFCGIIFIAAMGIVLAPIIHRFLHRFHLDEDK